MTQPNQPLVTDASGVLRFKPNALCVRLLAFGSSNGMSLNELAMLPFEDEDRAQFAQLIGYSLSGFGELSYVTNEKYESCKP